METIDLTEQSIKSIKSNKSNKSDKMNENKLIETNSDNLINSNFNFLDAINKATRCNNLSLSLHNANELKFKLDWKNRNQILQILNDYIEHLYIDNKIDPKYFMENKNNLIKILTNLQLKLDHTNLENTIKSKNKLITIIDSKLKSEIINQLVKNECLAINYRDQIKDNLIKKLIQENQDLINKLINLEVDFTNDLIGRKRKFDDDDDETESEDDSDLVSKMVNNHENCINNLKKQISNLKNELDELKSITFNCILNDVNTFEDDNSFISKPFKYMDSGWRIRINSSIDDIDNKRYLEFYIRCINSLDDKNNINWQLEVDYELRLKNNLPIKFDRIFKLYNTFKKDTDYGTNKFILIDDLLNLNNGFVKNNSINLEVHLKGDRIIRDI